MNGKRNRLEGTNVHLLSLLLLFSFLHSPCQKTNITNSSRFFFFLFIYCSRHEQLTIVKDNNDGNN